MSGSGTIEFWWPVVMGTILSLTLVIAVVGAIVARQQSKIRATREKLEIIESGEKRYEALFNNVSDIVYVHSPNGEILQVNEAGIRLVADDCKQIVGRNLRDFVLARYRNMFGSYLSRFSENGGSGEFTGVLPIFSPADLRMHYLEFHSSFHPQNGQASTVQGIARDITAKLMTDRQLRRSERKLRALLSQSEFMQERLSQLSQSILRVQEEERKSMSRSLHDDIGHILATVLLDLQIIGKNSAPQNEEVHDRVHDARLLTEQAIASMRRFLRDLRPEVLDQLGLIPSIRQFANDYSRRTGIRTTVIDPSEPIELSADQKLALYRIIQESLANTARHSKAKNVTISVQQNGPVIIAEIKDDGAGFDQTSIYSKDSALHLGILSMQERAKLVDGECVVRSARNEGTVVTVRIHLTLKKAGGRT